MKLAKFAVALSFVVALSAQGYEVDEITHTAADWPSCLQGVIGKVLGRTKFADLIVQGSFRYYFGGTHTFYRFTAKDPQGNNFSGWTYAKFGKQRKNYDLRSGKYDGYEVTCHLHTGAYPTQFGNASHASFVLRNQADETVMILDGYFRGQ